MWMWRCECVCSWVELLIQLIQGMLLSLHLTSGQCGAWSRSPSCLLLIVMSNTAARVTRDTGHVTPVIQSVAAGCNVIKSLLQKVYGSVASVASLVLLWIIGKVGKIVSVFGSEVSSEVRRALLLLLLTEGYKLFTMKCSPGLQGTESLILYDCRHPQIVMSVCMVIEV